MTHDNPDLTVSELRSKIATHIYWALSQTQNPDYQGVIRETTDRIEALLLSHQTQLVERLMGILQERDLCHAAEDIESQDTTSRRRELVWVRQKLEAELKRLKGEK